jgi:hypothetical protein
LDDNITFELELVPSLVSSTFVSSKLKLLALISADLLKNSESSLLEEPPSFSNETSSFLISYSTDSDYICSNLYVGREFSRSMSSWMIDILGTREIVLLFFPFFPFFFPFLLIVAPFEGSFEEFPLDMMVEFLSI